MRGRPLTSYRATARDELSDRRATGPLSSGPGLEGRGGLVVRRSRRSLETQRGQREGAGAPRQAVHPQAVVEVPVSVGVPPADRLKSATDDGASETGKRGSSTVRALRRRARR